MSPVRAVMPSEEERRAMAMEFVSIASLMLAIVCVWSPRTYLWAIPFGLFVATGLASGWLLPSGLLWGLLLALVVRFHVVARTRLTKAVAMTLLALMSLYFGVHLVPGFELFRYFEETRLSENSGWTALNFSADKPLVGLFLLLAYRDRLCKSVDEWRTAVAVTAIPVAIGIGFVYVVGLLIGYVGFDPTLSPLVLVWFVRNLLFTVIAEELLFRQVLQFHLEKTLTGRHGKLIALAGASVLFGAVHLWGGWQYGLLATVSGVVYGYAFMRSGRIEMAIAAHVVLNTGHLLLLSYPTLLICCR